MEVLVISYEIRQTTLSATNRRIKSHLPNLLAERGWSQADLARKTGIRANTINEIYGGFADKIQLEHLALICEVLNCQPADIFEFVSRSATNPSKLNLAKVDAAKTKRLRRQAGMTGAEFGYAVGASQSMISHIEIGSKVPGAELLARMAVKLGVSIDALMKKEKVD